MRSAALRLDCFSAGMIADRSRAGTHEIESAFQRGHEQGLNEGREASLDALATALARLQGDMAAHDTMAAAMRRQALSDILPVLDAIIDLLGARSARDRLHDALTKELRHIAEIATPQRLVIRCAADQRPDIDDCLAKAGFSGAVIEEIQNRTLTVDLVADRATVTFDPDAATAALRSIINDIMTED